MERKIIDDVVESIHKTNRHVTNAAMASADHTDKMAATIEGAIDALVKDMKGALTSHRARVRTNMAEFVDVMSTRLTAISQLLADYMAHCQRSETQFKQQGQSLDLIGQEGNGGNDEVERTRRLLLGGKGNGRQELSGRTPSAIETGDDKRPGVTTQSRPGHG